MASHSRKGSFSAGSFNFNPLTLADTLSHSFNFRPLKMSDVSKRITMRVDSKKRIKAVRVGAGAGGDGSDAEDGASLLVGELKKPDHSAAGFDADRFLEEKCRDMSLQEIEGVCEELTRHKNASAEEMRKSVFSNYTAFIRTSKEILELENKLTSMRNLLSMQASLLHALTQLGPSSGERGSAGSGPAEGNHNDNHDKESGEKEPAHAALASPGVKQPPGLIPGEAIWPEEKAPSQLQRRAQELPDVLLILVEEALALLKEGEELAATSEAAREGKGEEALLLLASEFLTPPGAAELRSQLAERRDSLVEQLVHAVQQPSCAGLELKAATLALRELDEGQLAHTLLLRSHGARLRRLGQHIRPSRSSYGGTYTAALSQLAFSTIHQAARDSEAIFGGHAPFASELTVWAERQVEWHAALLAKNVLSSSVAAGGLHAAAECARIALNHCRLLEAEGLCLGGVLTKLLKDSLKGALEAAMWRIKELVATMAAVDKWVLQPLPPGMGPAGVELDGGRGEAAGVTGAGNATPGGGTAGDNASSEDNIHVAQAYLPGGGGPSAGFEARPGGTEKIPGGGAEGTGGATAVGGPTEGTGGGLMLSISAQRLYTLLQELVEDVSPALGMGMVGPTLEKLAQLFESYVKTLHKALPGTSDSEVPLWEAHTVGYAADERKQLALLGNAAVLADALIPDLARRMLLTAQEEQAAAAAAAPPDGRRGDERRAALLYSAKAFVEQKEFRRRLQRAVDELRDTLCSCFAADFMYNDDGEPILSPYEYLVLDSQLGPLEWQQNPLPSQPLHMLYAALSVIREIADEVLPAHRKATTLLLMRLAETLIAGLIDDAFWEVLEQGDYAFGPTGLQQFLLDMYFMMQFAANGGYSSRAMRQVALDAMARAITVYKEQAADDPNECKDEWFQAKCQEACQYLRALQNGVDPSEIHLHEGLEIGVGHRQVAYAVEDEEDDEEGNENGSSLGPSDDGFEH
eukprot:jgi/Mesen1/9182/ME000591S08503